ncbi:hypothetical protein WMF31_02495 [Sorangium sp. So ce1036]|uniref:hypothetical protein n=1 Tax=Sorangium sp. So ce1036 TaxID=3133328 RepID=UPI003F05466C
MLRSDPISLHVPEPLALIDATLLFTVQVLVARHPELLLPPEVTLIHPPPGLRTARRLLEGIRELHRAIEAYRELLTGEDSDRRPARPIEPDEIPF